MYLKTTREKGHKMSTDTFIFILTNVSGISSAKKSHLLKKAALQKQFLQRPTILSLIRPFSMISYTHYEKTLCNAAHIGDLYIHN